MFTKKKYTFASQQIISRVNRAFNKSSADSISFDSPVDSSPPGTQALPFAPKFFLSLYTSEGPSAQEIALFTRLYPVHRQILEEYAVLQPITALCLSRASYAVCLPVVLRTITACHDRLSRFALKPDLSNLRASLSVGGLLYAEHLAIDCFSALGQLINHKREFYLRGEIGPKPFARLRWVEMSFKASGCCSIWMPSSEPVSCRFWFRLLCELVQSVEGGLEGLVVHLQGKEVRQEFFEHTQLLLDALQPPTAIIKLSKDDWPRSANYINLGPWPKGRRLIIEFLPAPDQDSYTSHSANCVRSSQCLVLAEIIPMHVMELAKGYGQWRKVWEDGFMVEYRTPQAERIRSTVGKWPYRKMSEGEVEDVEQFAYEHCNFIEIPA